MKKAVVYSCAAVLLSMGQQAEYCSTDILDQSHGCFSPSGCKSNFLQFQDFFRNLETGSKISTSILSDTSEMMSRTCLSTAVGLSAKGEETLNDGEAGEENSMLVEDEYGDGVRDILNIGDPESSKFLGGDGVNSQYGTRDTMGFGMVEAETKTSEVDENNPKKCCWLLPQE